MLVRLARELLAERRIVYKDRVFCGLLIIGPTGVGKSYFASAFANAAAEVEVPCLYTSVADYLNSLRRSYDSGALDTYDQALARAINAPLLVLDDFGAQRGTEWAWEQLYILVDKRTAKFLPTIVTANRPMEEILAKTQDWNAERIVSRLKRLLQVSMDGEDKR